VQVPVARGRRRVKSSRHARCLPKLNLEVLHLGLLLVEYRLAPLLLCSTTIVILALRAFSGSSLRPMRCATSLWDLSRIQVLEKLTFPWALTKATARTTKLKPDYGLMNGVTSDLLYNAVLPRGVSPWSLHSVGSAVVR
jgi:hypothetical protein